MQAIIYDVTGRHPQCSQGKKAYMTDCVLPSDFYSYILSADPVLDTSGKTCADLGYAHVSTDPIFHGFELYWKGGASAMSAFEKSFRMGHPDTGKFLNASRDYNPACSLAAAPAAAPAAAGSAAAPPADAGAIVTSFDKSGALPQCAEGPAAYMTGCVHPCDFVAYFKSQTPTLLQGSHCKAMGFTFESMDNIYTPVRLFWKTGSTPSMSDYFGAYFKNHTNAFAYLNYTRDHNPACKLPALPLY